MNRGVLILTGGIVIHIALTALFLWRAVPSISNGIEARSGRALSDRNVNWASIDVDGRDVTLSGLSPSDKQLQRALTALDGVAGIRIIVDQTISLTGKAPPTRDARTVGNLPVPAEEQIASEANRSLDMSRLGLGYLFSVTRSAERIVLGGMVPDELARDALLDIARQRFDGEQVDDELMISPNAPADFIVAAGQAITLADLVANGETGLRDQVLYVEGLTSNDRDLNRLRETIDATLPTGYEAQLQVGSRQTLAAILRENPDLAARVGSLPNGDPASGTIDLGLVPALDRSPEASTRCQLDVDALMANARINFETGSSAISPDSQNLVNELVRIAKSCPAARIQIAGHTDDQGSEDNNLALSQKRAEAVMEYFVKNGIKLGRLSARGFGESQPLVENKSAADRARNRRIELQVLR